MAEGVFTKAALPDWLLNLGLTKHMREVDVAFRELKVRSMCFQPRAIRE